MQMEAIETRGLEEGLPLGYLTGRGGKERRR